MDLYLLQDGTYADPADVSDEGGVLRHKNGLAVALYEDGSPQTLKRGAVDNKNVDAATMDEKPKAAPAVNPAPSDAAKAGEKPAMPAGRSGHEPSPAPATSAKPKEAPAKVNKA